MNDKKYEYHYWLSYLGDGQFNQVDSQLTKWLNEGFKPLREVNVGDSGYILFVLSRQKDTGV